MLPDDMERNHIGQCLAIPSFSFNHTDLPLILMPSDSSVSDSESIKLIKSEPELLWFGEYKGLELRRGPQKDHRNSCTWQIARKFELTMLSS